MLSVKKVELIQSIIALQGPMYKLKQEQEILPSHMLVRMVILMLQKSC